MFCEKKKESTAEALLKTTVVIYLLPSVTSPSRNPVYIVSETTPVNVHVSNNSCNGLQFPFHDFWFPFTIFSIHVTGYETSKML